MNKRLTLLFPLIIFATLLLGQTTPTPKSFPKQEGDNHEKYDQEKKKWIEQNPEEYRKMGGNPDPVNKQPIVVELDKDMATPVDNSPPTNGIYWKMTATDVEANNSSVSSASLAEVKKELEQDLSDRNWVWIIGDRRILIVANDGSFARYYEISDTQLVLKSNKDCDNCSSKTYSIKEKTDNILTISIPFDDNEAITSIFTFKKIARP